MFISGCLSIRAQTVSKFELAVTAIKWFERLHGPSSYPYVGYGHRLKHGEKLSWRMSERKADALLRKDLQGLCAVFRGFGRDSLLLATLAYNVGAARLLGYGKMPKSTLIRKLEAGNRDIYADFIRYCHYKGKKIPSIERRRKEEYNQLYIR